MFEDRGLQIDFFYSYECNLCMYMYIYKPSN